MARLALVVLALYVVAGVATMEPVTAGSGAPLVSRKASIQDRAQVENFQVPEESTNLEVGPSRLNSGSSFYLRPYLPVEVLSTVTPLPEPTRAPSDRSGRATYYGPGFAGQPMANGEPFDPWAMTAACNTCELGDVLTVTYSKTVTVTVTDRGDFSHALDLSQGAFVALVGSVEPGVIEVSIGGRP